jgi:hypothetical protein
MDMQTPRNCYAAETLLAEVQQLFPETCYKMADPDPRQTNLTVIFDLASTDAPADLHRLLALVATDERVAEVGRADGDGDGYFVRFISSARTQDLRDSFSLVEAWDIMNEPVALPEQPAVIAGFPTTEGEQQ